MTTFTPEFTIDERGEFILVANHNLEATRARKLSIEYNRARIRFGFTHVPPELNRCRLIYDVRGQDVSAAVLNDVRKALSDMCHVEFKT